MSGVAHVEVAAIVTVSVVDARATAVGQARGLGYREGGVGRRGQFVAVAVLLLLLGPACACHMSRGPQAVQPPRMHAPRELLDTSREGERGDTIT